MSLATIAPFIRLIFFRLFLQLLLKIAIKPTQRFLCRPKRLSLIAKHTLGSLFDSFSNLRDPLPCLFFFGQRITHPTPTKRTASRLQRLIRPRDFGIPIRLVKLLRQQRLKGLRFFDRLLHLFPQLFHRILLIGELLLQILFPIGIFPQRTIVVILFLLRLCFLSKRVADLFLFLLQLLSLFSHLPHLLGKLTGGAILKLISKLFQITLGPRSFGGRSRDLVLLQCFTGTLNILASLVQLLRLLGHSLLILFALHSLAQLFGIAKQLLLLLPKRLQPPLDLFAFLFGFGFFERRLKLFNPLVQIALPPSQLLQPIKHLPIFLGLLLLLRLFLGRSFVLVPILVFL